MFDSQEKRVLLEKKILGYQINIAATKKALLANHKRVAIVTMHSDSVWARRVAKGCISSMCNAVMPTEPPLYDVFSAECSVTRLHEDVLGFIQKQRKEYSLIITIGEWASKHVYEFQKDNDDRLPQIFLGVRDPVALGLIESLTTTSGSVTGVVSVEDDYDWQVRAVRALKPNVKTVLIPFTPAFDYPGLREDIARLVASLEAAGLTPRIQEISTERKLDEQIRESGEGADVLWLMRDQYLQVYTKQLVTVCNELLLTMFSTELAAVFQGAAFGCGDSGTVLGAYGGHLALAILSGEYSAESLSVYIIEQPLVIRVNPKAIGTQGFDLTEDQRILVQEVIPLGWE